MCFSNCRLRFSDYCLISANHLYIKSLVQLLIVLLENQATIPF